MENCLHTNMSWKHYNRIHEDVYIQEGLAFRNRVEGDALVCESCGKVLERVNFSISPA